MAADARADRQWTVRDALEWTIGYLERKDDENPRLSAQWLMSAATGLSRVEIYTNYDRPLNADERAVLREGVKRRGADEPLQYVTGEMGFRHLVLRCEPGVLIPRPETEVLVEAVLPHLDACIEARGRAHVLEVGTGTGCIALSIAWERPEADVVATDVSPAAVALARRNAAALSLEERVQVIECDLVAGVDPGQAGTFDLLVSNPPYIPTDELSELPDEVAGFEPRLALDGGPDGLDVFRRLLDAAVGEKGMLAPGGMLACELHETTLEAAADLARAAGLTDVRIVKDLAGRQRHLLVHRGRS